MRLPGLLERRHARQANAAARRLFDPARATIAVAGPGPRGQPSASNLLATVTARLSEDPRRFFRRRFHADLSRAELSRRGLSAHVRAYGVDADAARFDAAVAASSFILDEVEEPLYDDGLFIHYTASIIEHMGGRGPGVVKAAREIYAQWAVNHHFEMYDDVAPTLSGCRRAG